MHRIKKQFRGGGETIEYTNFVGPSAEFSRLGSSVRMRLFSLFFITLLLRRHINVTKATPIEKPPVSANDFC